MKNDFCQWLREHTQYQSRVQSDIASRVKRANSILPLPDRSDSYYIYQLQHNEEYKALSTSVRSQIKKAVTLYFEYLDENI